MTAVSSVSNTVVSALAGAMTKVGESSLGRVVAGVDATAHNLIDGVTTPATRRIAMERGYQYRNNGAPGTEPVLAPQQLQVTKTSLDPRVMKIQRDAVAFMSRACRLSDAIKRNHPTFEDVGAVHLRLTLPVPTTTELSGFEHKSYSGGAPPRAAYSATDGSSSVADSESSGGCNSCTDPTRNFGRPAPLPQQRARTADSYDEWGGWQGPLRAPSRREVPEDDGPPPLEDEEEAEPDAHYEPGDDSSDEGEDWREMLEEVELARPWQDTETRARCPLGILGNALQARPRIEELAGITRSVSISTDCNFCKWLDMGQAKGFLNTLLRVANPIGACDLYVMDVIIPTALLTTCLESADSLAGEDKPAKNLLIQKPARKLKRIVNEKLPQDLYNYMETVTNLVIMALLLDVGDTGKNHCDIFAYSGEQPMFKDFFASTNLEDAIEDSLAAKKEAGHPVDGLVQAVPAPEIKGRLNEVVVMYETAAFGEYDLKPKKPVIGAVQVGVDLIGKAPPNDHTDPLSFVSAIYRHLGDNDHIVAEGTPFEYVIHLDRSEKGQLSPQHDRVWGDLVEDHADDFIILLRELSQKFDFDFLEDGKPQGYSTEQNERWLEEQLKDEAFYAADNALTELLRQTKATQKHMQQLNATGNLKKGEDSSRARAVITPGVAGSEGLHQVRNSPIVKALEALHAIKYNHTNLKGLTEETKRIRFAEFLRAVPKGGIVFGSDKKQNDSCIKERVWKWCIKYLARMADVFEEHTVTRPYVYSPNEHTTPDAFPNGKIDFKYWVMKLTPLLAFLLSGIGPTSFFNRLESEVEGGVAVLVTHGEEAYQKWRKAERNAKPSDHPAWNLHPLPHVAEIVEWAPLKPHMVTDTSVKVESLKEEQIESHHMGLNEGDDQKHAFIPPQTEEWKGLSPSDVAQKFAAMVSAATGFVFEIAKPADDVDMLGRGAVVEMCSAWIGLSSGKADPYDVAVIVPKVLKAIRKLTHVTISSQHTLVRNDDGEVVDVVRDAAFWSLALTKYYALAIINRESLGVRGLFLAHGDYCYENLERMLGRRGAYSFRTMYGDRDPEKRHIEEFASTNYGFCGEMRDQAYCALLAVKVERVARVCCVAWRAELSELATRPKEDVIASLMAFDSTTMTMGITDDHVSDPMCLWESLEHIGCILEPLVLHAANGHKKVAAQYRSSRLQADSEETVRLARIYAGTTPTGATSRDGRPDAHAGPSKGGGEKGKGKTKGKSDAKAKGGKSEGKSKGKSKGKASDLEPAKGKGYPKPSWKTGATDKWWQTGGR